MGAGKITSQGSSAVNIQGELHRPQGPALLGTLGWQAQGRSSGIGESWSVPRLALLAQMPLGGAGSSYNPEEAKRDLKHIRECTTKGLHMGEHSSSRAVGHPKLTYESRQLLQIQISK